jgi:hypothetical protein
MRRLTGLASSMSLGGWPRFERAVFSGWDSVPGEVRDTLMRAGPPKRSLGRLYWASTELASVEIPPRGRLIRFGHSGIASGIHLDPSTGEVLVVLDHAGAVPQLVNSTLAQFTDTVRTVIDMFPYYDRDGRLDEREAAAKRLAGAIRRIDPVAMNPDSFWGTFVDDVAIGDFATEDVVGGSSR